MVPAQKERDVVFPSEGPLSRLVQHSKRLVKATASSTGHNEAPQEAKYSVLKAKHEQHIQELKGPGSGRPRAPAWWYEIIRGTWQLDTNCVSVPYNHAS